MTTERCGELHKGEILYLHDRVHIALDEKDNFNAMRNHLAFHVQINENNCKVYSIEKSLEFASIFFKTESIIK